MQKWILLLFFTVVMGCGGATPGDVSDPSGDDDDLGVGYTAEDFVPRAELVRAELTTAVDAKRYRAAAPVTDRFEAGEDIIFFVGRLKKVPTDANIEVRWFLDADPKPMLISDIQGSDNFQFIASFSPQDARFINGSYSARVFINGDDIGGTSFVIGNPDEAGVVLVKNVKFSTAISGNMAAKKPKTKFKKGIRKLYVSFDVKGAEMRSFADVHWYRGQEEFHNSEVELTGNKRYAAHVASPSGLPNGEYKVDILVAQQPMATKTVVIGKAQGGPAIDEIALGLALQDNNMPKRAMSKFKRDTTVIQCGLRFLDLPAESVIELHWFLIESDGEMLLYKNRSSLPSGGSGTMGAAWELTHELDPGEYKVVVMVNEEPLGEEPFEII